MKNIWKDLRLWYLKCTFLFLAIFSGVFFYKTLNITSIDVLDIDTDIKQKSGKRLLEL